MIREQVLLYYKLGNNSSRKVINPLPAACLHLILHISSTRAAARSSSCRLLTPSHLIFFTSQLLPKKPKEKKKKKKDKPFLTFFADYRHPQIENPNRANPSIPSNSIDSPRICSNRRFDSLIGTVVCSSRAWLIVRCAL